MVRRRRSHFKDLPVGPSRHLVRFLVVDGRTYALKEEPLRVAQTEFDVLRHLEEAELPAVTAVGLAASPERDAAILMTEYLAFSIQYRRLLMRFPLGPGPYRERLLDAMAWLLVDLHRAGVFWGDCSLANTLFRRDGDKIQAFLVDAETSEIHPGLSDGQRAYDLEILVENVAFGLADVAALQGRPEAFDDAVAAAEMVRSTYRSVWDELHHEPELARVRPARDPGPHPAAQRPRLRGRRDPDGAGRAAPGGALGSRPAQRRGLEPPVPRSTARATDGSASPSRARRGCCSTTSASTGPGSSSTTAARSTSGRARSAGFATCSNPLSRSSLPPSAKVATCSRRIATSSRRSGSSPSSPGKDVGLEAALDAYLGLGAPAPEDDRGPTRGLDRARHRLVGGFDQAVTGSRPPVPERTHVRARPLERSGPMRRGSEVAGR